MGIILSSALTVALSSSLSQSAGLVQDYPFWASPEFIPLRRLEGGTAPINAVGEVGHVDRVLVRHLRSLGRDGLDLTDGRPVRRRLGDFADVGRVVSHDRFEQIARPGGLDAGVRTFIVEGLEEDGIAFC